jgi:hypothetical protein
MSSGKTIEDPEMAKWISDVLSEGRSNRFLLIGDRTGGSSVIISDWRWWADNERVLNDYCDLHGIAIEGMLLKFPSDKVMTLFMLRWGN